MNRLHVQRLSAVGLVCGLIAHLSNSFLLAQATQTEEPPLDSQVLIVRKYLGHTEGIVKLDVAPDGKHFVSGSADGTVRVWEVDTGEQIFEEATGGWVHGLAFSPDNRHVLYSKLADIGIYDVQERQVVGKLTGHETLAIGVDVSPDGRRVVTGAADGLLIEWDFEQRKEIRRLKGHTDRVFAVQYSDDGKQIVSASFDRTLRAWDRSSGEMVQIIRLSAEAMAISISPNGQFVTVPEGKDIVIWDLLQGDEVRRLSRHTNHVQRGSVFSSDGRLLLSTSHDHTAKLWQTGTGWMLYNFTAHTDSVIAGVLTADGKYALTAGYDKEIILWQLPDFARSPELVNQGPEPTVSELNLVMENPRLLYLNSADMPDPGGIAKPAGGLLVRELVRQAVLIAARNELGVQVMDRTLGDRLPDDVVSSQAVVVDIAVRVLPKDFSVLTSDTVVEAKLSISKNDKRQVFWSARLPLSSERWQVDYQQLAIQLEELSRGELVTSLKRLGLNEKPVEVRADGDLPADVAELLQEFRSLTQFAALRRLHALIRDSGESPLRLAALVRAYGNLGQLTRPHWASLHKAFKARSLLYAQRLAASNPGQAESYFCRAYAAAMCGLPAVALENFAEGDKILQEDAEQSSVPTWANVVRAYSRHDLRSLRSVMTQGGRDAQLAGYLAFLVAGGDAVITEEVVRIGREVLEGNPECLAIYDAMCTTDSVGTGHQVTAAGRMIIENTLPDRILEMPDLPIEIEDAAFSEQPIADIPLALLKSGEAGNDIGEPTWSTLGTIIQETLYKQVFWRAYFLKYYLGVDVADFLAESAPWVEHHRYAAFLQSMGIDSSRQPAEYRQLFRKLTFPDVEINTSPMMYAAWSMEGESTKNLGTVGWNQAYYHTDFVSDDLIMMMAYARGHDRAICARKLLIVCPHRPDPVAELIANEWDYAQQHIEHWKKQYGNQAAVVTALARQYVLQKHPDAETWLRKSMELSTDSWGYTTLAELYREQGDQKRWKSTLDEFLELPVEGLDHAQVQVMIANRLMDQEKWEEAEPYAAAAAETWAGWAMQCASECYEGLEKWDEAEQWIRNCSERYGESRFDWYFFCARTGHGNREVALQFVMNQLNSVRDQLNYVDLCAMGVMMMLDQDLETARDAFREAFAKSNQPFAAMHIALLTDILGDEEAREAAYHDALYKSAVSDDHNNSFANERNVARQLYFALKDDHPPDFKAINDLLDASAPNVRTSQEYFVGKFLLLRQDQDNGIKYLRRCAAGQRTGSWNQVLAVDTLRRLDAENAPADGE